MSGRLPLDGHEQLNLFDDLETIHISVPSDEPRQYADSDRCNHDHVRNTDGTCSTCGAWPR